MKDAVPPIAKLIFLSNKTQREISKDSGVDYTTLSLYKNGRLPIKEKHRPLLAAYFQIKETEL